MSRTWRKTQLLLLCLAASFADASASPDARDTCPEQYAVFPLHSGMATAFCEARECPSEGRVDWRLLRHADHRFLLGVAQRSVQVAAGGWRRVVVPGYWGTAPQGHYRNTGAGLFRVRLSFPTDRARRCFNHLYVKEVSSATTILWNGRAVGSIGRPGNDRPGEVARMIPAIIHLPEGSALDENVLDLLVTNHHARGGGIHSIILGTRTAVLRARNRDMLQTGFVLGVVGLATAFFLFLFLATRSTYAYPAFAALLLCLLMRTASSGAVLEQWFGNGWTDKRLLLEYFSGISLTPPAFFWFLFFLFPNLRLARADSPAEQWTRLFFLGGGGILTTVGIALSVWFVWCGDATVYGVHQPELVVGFLAPSIVFVLLTIVVCVLRRLPGSRSILCGTLALSAAAALDAVSVMHGDVSSLYVPLGTTVLVLAFCIAPAQQFQRLHRRAVASGVVLESTNKELRKRERSKAEFLAAYSRTLVEPLQVMADAALLRAQDDPSRENWLWVEQTQAAIAPLQRLEQWSRLQSNESVPVPLGVAATLGVGAQILGSVTGILPSLDVPPSLPPVRGRPELMQLLFGELAENLHRHAEPHLISIAARLEGTAVRVSILAQGHSCSLPEKHLLREFRSGHSSGSGMGVGLAIITRVIELHGGQLRVTNSCHGDQESTEYTFSLRTARHTRQQHLALLEKSYDFFCSEMGARKF